MPSHTVSSALVALYNDVDGAPWCYSQWKDITGVHHGLDSLENDKLPRGWTPADRESVMAYFSQYKNLPTEDARQKFASACSGGVVPGRTKWNHWVSSNWTKWKIHARIADVLSARDMHPVTILVQNKGVKTVSSSLYLPAVLEDIGLALYGEESLDDSGHLSHSLRGPTLQLAQRTWSTLTKQLSRSKQRLAVLETTATAAYNELDREQPRKGKVSAVIRALVRWKMSAELFKDDVALSQIQTMEVDLEQLLDGLSKSVKAIRKKSTKDLAKLDPKALDLLATTEDVNELIDLYKDLVSNDSASAMDPIIDSQPSLRIPFGEPIDGADPGVEIEAGMSPEQLSQNLGLKEQLPWLFNTHREDINKGNIPLSLHWHQLAGAHAIIRKTFSATPDPNGCTGLLVSDDVGLGKTFLAGAVIAILADIVIRQQMKKALPPIISTNPYLKNHLVLPHLPHLIVVPGTLLSQWDSELRVILKTGTFDIFLYGNGKDAQESFWSPNGPYNKSIHTSNKIIIASHSAIINDFTKLYRSVGKKKLPWDPRSPIRDFDSLVQKTIFNQNFLSITIDEAHEFRNNTKHAAALTLVKQAIIKIIATATPLQTSNQDSAAMGRLCGIPYFLSEEAYNDEKQDAKNLRRAKKELAEIQAEWPEDAKDGDSTEYKDDGKAVEVTENPLKLCQIQIAQTHQQRFDGRIIRRTINSRTWDNKPVLALPPCINILGVVELTQREKDIITVLSDNVKEDVSAANGTKKISSKSFYIEYRMAVGYAIASGSVIPYFNSLEEWEAAKSTKMDIVAKIIKHTLSSDQALPVTFIDGQPIFTPIPPLAAGEVPSNKVVVFQEFPSLGRVLRNVFDLYQIAHVYIDGQMSYEKRAEIVKKFNQDENIRTLIFSSVGSVGLNLARASTIIFLDQPWSAQDERQIRGRVHRIPQNQVVKCYHVLGMGTADMILSDQARGKRDMMEAFLSEKRGQELFNLFSGQSLDTDEDPDKVEVDDDVDINRNSKGKKEKAAKREKKEKSKRVKNSKKDQVHDTSLPGGNDTIGVSIGVTAADGLEKSKSECSPPNASSTALSVIPTCVSGIQSETDGTSKSQNEHAPAHDGDISMPGCNNGTIVGSHIELAQTAKGFSDTQTTDVFFDDVASSTDFMSELSMDESSGLSMQDLDDISMLSTSSGDISMTDEPHAVSSPGPRVARKSTFVIPATPRTVPRQKRPREVSTSPESPRARKWVKQHILNGGGVSPPSPTLGRTGPLSIMECGLQHAGLHTQEKLMVPEPPMPKPRTNNQHQVTTASAHPISQPHAHLVYGLEGSAGQSTKPPAKRLPPPMQPNPYGKKWIPTTATVNLSTTRPPPVPATDPQIEYATGVRRNLFHNSQSRQPATSGSSLPPITVRDNQGSETTGRTLQQSFPSIPPDQVVPASFVTSIPKVAKPNPFARKRVQAPAAAPPPTQAGPSVQQAPLNARYLGDEQNFQPASISPLQRPIPSIPPGDQVVPETLTPKGAKPNPFVRKRVQDPVAAPPPRQAGPSVQQAPLNARYLGDEQNFQPPSISAAITRNNKLPANRKR